ncbi:hypothetical protein DLD77_02580 [Chitinophaga alhagiae]|uniref:Iron dicitrate transport regulator FecR n=1 Tax=Chitinophaga alhagiae TaxID=2203219 RepID=A0ABM6W9R8_9BACT|nr:FecR family protein [Chitinophaga alhagiae]AWO00662.1 hypothetical protein DLD77_02580 [Chitinophaga alhagiae]
MEQQQLPHHIAELIFKHFREGLQPDEQARLNNWLAADERNRTLFDAFSNPSMLEKEMAFFDRLDLDADWEAVAVRAGYDTGRNTRPRRRMLYWSAAASILLATGIFLLWPGRQAAPPAQLAATAPATAPQPGGNKAMLRLSSGQTVSLGHLAGDTVLSEGGSRISGQSGQLVYDEAAAGEAVTYNTLSTPRGGQFRLTLADGTQVWLNASSSIRFPTRFTAKDRTVELTGEGYFEVTKDHKPFYVSINGMKVAVLGTRFNVMGYNGITRTTLAEGAVKIQLPGDRSWNLKPGQQAVVAVDNNDVTVTPADIGKALAWKNGLFYFKDDAMADIIAQLARWYDVEVSVKGPMPARLFSGNIRRQASLAQVLDMLGYVSGAKSTVEGRTVTIQF